jgi:MORN repeat variant
MIDKRRSYYDHGSLRAESTLIDGVPHGVNRRWHPNGVLAEEIPLDHGIIDGTVKQWNERGELLGSCVITKGTGVHRTWHQNGRLWSEVTMIDGKYTGRYRVYWEDGELAGDTYWIRDEKVSRKRYVEACRQDPTLPTYADAPPKPKKAPGSKKRPPRADAGKTVDKLARELLEGPSVREALTWLTETKHPSRSLGETTSQEASSRLVKKIYGLGAVTVHAVGIDGGPDEDQNSGRLIVELPQRPGARKKVLKFCGGLAFEAGFDPAPDVGQRYVLLMLD